MKEKNEANANQNQMIGSSQMIARSEIRPDPNQPRKTFSEESLKELADSIRQQGIIQPLILESMPAPFTIHGPDLTSDKWRVVDNATKSTDEFERENLAVLCAGGEGNLKPYYRIVCGERRWRAAEIAELTKVPAMVYAGLTEKQRFDFQFIENNQRENVTALEEAEAIRRELDKRKLSDPAFSPDTLAKELGISRAALYERLKLTRLHPPIREALLAGKISVSIAGEIAKLPTTKSQESLLKDIEDTSQYRPMSVRDVQENIDEQYVKQLSDAPFDTKKEAWFTGGPIDCSRLPEGVCLGSCTQCPARTGNMLAEFPELKSRPNVCTRPDCFAEKCKAHWLAVAQDEAQKGKTILTEKEFKKVRSGYQAEDEFVYGTNKQGTLVEMMGKAAPEPILVSTADGLKKYYPNEAATVALKKQGVKLPKKETPEEKAKAGDERKAAEARKAIREKLVENLLPELAAGIAKVSDKDAWEIAANNLGTHSWGAVKKHLVEGKKGRSLVLGAIVGNECQVINYEGDWNKDGLATWKALGVDLLAEEKASQVPAALPLAKGEAKQKKLLDTPAKPAKKKK